MYILVASGIKINFHGQPGASGCGFAGLFGDRLKIKLSAPAVDGRANRALSEFLADFFDVPKSCVTITRGASGRQKTVLIEGDQNLLLAKLKSVCT